jgi:hypothetical protein
MNARTLKALHGSIIKWAKIVAGTGVNHGSTNCPLCKLFLDNDCKGCPVFIKTGLNSCIDTPYEDYIESSSLKARARHALAELKFLTKLLP